MYQYVWDPETGGLLLTSEVSKFSKEPRPVYYRELDLLGFDQYWNYPKDDSAPIMWAESNNYIYQGRVVARTKGGSVYTAPEIIVIEEPEPSEQVLHQVDVSMMVEKNRELLDTLAQETIQNIYNTYRKYRDSIDVFYVAFSGGKDSVVALDLVQRALPHDEICVLFGDTHMEFPDTYTIVEQVEQLCSEEGIRFYRASSKLNPLQTWKVFGPPATANRWCCSVHKTSPQIRLLREITEKNDFTGMAFTGIRAEESLTRSEYETISIGKKHTGQMSFHTILEWNSAELFLYIYMRGLLINEAYKKGNARAGCLVCPNSSGKHEYVKRSCYKNEVDQYLALISSTSGKTNYTQEEMKSFIDAGYWRTRRSGKELNFPQDCFEAKLDVTPQEIVVYRDNFQCEQWAKTIGTMTDTEHNSFIIECCNKLYEVERLSNDGITRFRFLNCGKGKDDVRFLSLFRSAVIKSLYCIGCGVCEAECKNGCINMKHGITISDECVHCHKCHDVHEHCLRYNSIRNTLTEGKKMESLDRYFSFGTRASWVDTYCRYNGGNEFWESDGDGAVANKKKDAFKNFVIDSELAVFEKKAMGDKYTKCKPTELVRIINKLGATSEVAWAIILCNLVYKEPYKWFVHNLSQGTYYSPDALKLMLNSVMENDAKGLGRRNVIDAFKITMCKTPLGTEGVFVLCDIDEKTNSSGQEIITLHSVERCQWQNPDPKVILYSLYKFAENCGDYYQFSLETLLDDSIERDGVSPTRIFGLDEETVKRILNGLAVNYPEYVSVSFTLDLDSITLRPEKTSADVLQLF